ncbi:ABC transporter permease, partial [Methylicorpusculum sp.]|uniref:MlaE family ABC transporter permease n=1 Tax=Methylicorpusculum sp. TaxID=2713644 RepID=UPI002AB99582
MTELNLEVTPTLDVLDQDGERSVQLSGVWNLRGLTAEPALTQKITRLVNDNKVKHWDMQNVEVLDNAAALMLWQAWGNRLPDGLQLRPEHQRLFERWQEQVLPPLRAAKIQFWPILQKLLKDFWLQLVDVVFLLGQLFLDISYLLRHPSEIPWAEISITIYESGVRALGITALVGFLIGIVLSYLSALQLKIFGAEIYIIDILGLSIIRELGPLLAAILVAGRSGSAMTAQIGIMRVTEELDALSAMGISHSVRIILPNVAALTLIMPLISIWTDAAALIGGMFSAQNTLDISYQQFFFKLPDVVPLANVFIGIGKSAVFGLMIALIACHFG